VDSIRRTERLVVDDERRPAIASRVVLPDPAGPGGPLARVIWLETARAARERRELLAKLRRGPERGRL